MDYQSLLSGFGIREKKAEVYMACLELGSATVLPIAQKAGVNRTTAYDLLEDLQIRGLVSYRELRGRRYYRCNDPRKFQQMVEQQQKTVEATLPELLALYKPSKEKPAVRFYEDKEEIALIYKELLKATHIDAYGNFTKAEQYFPDFPKYVTQQLRRGIKVRDLVMREGVSDQLKSLYNAPKQELRFLPEHLSIETDTIIFGDSVAMISYGETVHGLVIESKAIADTQRKVFEELWAVGEMI